MKEVARRRVAPVDERIVAVHNPDVRVRFVERRDVGVGG
jgi:hypothetical protein